MEKVYRKVGRKYVSCGFNSMPDMSDGIWIVKSNANSKSHTSLFWKVGNLDRPCDVVTHAALQSIEQDLANYLVRLGDEKSKEFAEAKDISGGYLTKPVGYYNISAGELVSLLLRRMAIHLEDGEKLSWDSLQLKFREQVLKSYAPEYDDQVKTLYAFTKWLNESGVKFRQGKNIG
jgi:hypothetical protein